MSAQVIIGIDDRIDEDGVVHPWRIVSMSPHLPGGRIQHLVALPDGPTYVSPPRHPLYGDLTRLGAGLATQLAALVGTLVSIGAGEAHVAHGAPDSLLNTLIWNGIEPRTHPVEREDGVMLDAFSIGGDAGHQITVMEIRIRSAR